MRESGLKPNAPEDCGLNFGSRQLPRFQKTDGQAQQRNESTSYGYGLGPNCPDTAEEARGQGS